MINKFNEFLNEGEGEKKKRRQTPNLKFYGHRNERDGQVYFNAIYASPFGTKMHGAGEIYELTFIILDDKEISKDQNAIEYWGWLTDDNRVSMIFPAYFLFNMCFPAGAKKTEEMGGEGERVKLELVDEKIYHEEKGDEGKDKRTK
jgi:hypothetical protein